MLNGKKSYNFSDKTHSKDGKLATGLGIISVAILLLLIVKTIISKGNVSTWFGFAGIVAVLLSFCGIIIAAFSFREEDSLRTFSWLGLLLNLAIIGILLALFFVGL